jgi:hypothetical protein
MALSRDNVWLDLAGLPPKRLPDYYAGFDLPRLAAKWIFGTDWPGVPGVARNARAVEALGLPDDVLAGVLAGHAARVYLRSLSRTSGGAPPAPARPPGGGEQDQPSSSRADANAATATSRSGRVCAADSCVRILALPTGTTG